MDLKIMPSTLRRMLEEGGMNGRKEGGVWYVELPEKGGELVPIKSQLATNGPRELAEQESSSRELVDTLRKQLESQANQIKIKDSQIEELHLFLKQSLRNRRNTWWPFTH